MKGFVFSLCMVALFAANLSAGVFVSEQGILVSDSGPNCANGVCTPLRNATVAVARVATAPVRMVAASTPVRSFVRRAPVRSFVRRLGCCR